jgi:hypothetical protein
MNAMSSQKRLNRKTQTGMDQSMWAIRMCHCAFTKSTALRTKDDTMIGLGIADLDEIVLSVRNRESRAYVLEAIQAYRGGAHRAAVISTWIAVAFDIISKIRELSNHGDRAAMVFIQELESAIGSETIRPMQAIESGLLETAHKQFGFLSSVEFTDLSRLKDDRNFCAHPAFVGDGVLFQPSPELVRTHIVHAIKHLLEHPPVQGKAAIDRILADLQRESFPESQATVTQFMSDRYFNNAKESLIRNVTVVLLKELFSPNYPTVGDAKVLHVLTAVMVRHPAVYETLVSEKLAGLIAPLEDEEAVRLFALIRIDPRVWRWLSDADQLRLKGALKAGGLAEAYHALIDMPELTETMLEVFNKLPLETQSAVARTNPSRHLVEPVLAQLPNCRRFENSKPVMAAIASLAAHLNTDEVRIVLKASKENKFIYDASEVPRSMERLFVGTTRLLTSTGHDWVEFQELVESLYPENQYFRYSGLRSELEKHGLLKAKFPNV